MRLGMAAAEEGEVTRRCGPISGIGDWTAMRTRVVLVDEKGNTGVGRGWARGGQVMGGAGDPANCPGTPWGPP